MSIPYQSDSVRIMAVASQEFVKSLDERDNAKGRTVIPLVIATILSLWSKARKKPNGFSSLDSSLKP